MQEFIADSSINPKSFYLNQTQIQEMSLNGMIIGSHTNSHPVMSRLTKTEQEEEINISFRLVGQVCPMQKAKTFCYPYGGFHTFNESTLNILTNQQVDFAFNVEHRDITENDIKNQKLFLPRYDCNKFKYGQVRTHTNGLLVK